MSFDIFFQPCRFAANPGGEPLTAEEERAVRALLAQACPGGPDEHHCWCVDVPDGGSAEVFAEDLGKGCMFAMRGMTPDLVRLAFDILVAGHWVMIPAMEDTRAIAASTDAIRGVPEGFPEVLVCESANALGAFLEGGFEAWARYRDQVIGG